MGADEGWHCPASDPLSRTLLAPFCSSTLYTLTPVSSVEMDEDEHFDVDPVVDEQEQQALMAAAQQHTSYSIYEPHYEQMHPLIYFEDPNSAHHYHHIAPHPHAHFHHIHHQHPSHQLSLPLADSQQQIKEHSPSCPAANSPATVTIQHTSPSHRNGHSESPKRGQQIEDESDQTNQQDSPSAATNRELHNEIERKRRFRIKQCCDTLRILVPGVNDRTDKASVLEHTVKFVNHIVQCPEFRCNCEF